jgi:hypothetical protein
LGEKYLLVPFDSVTREVDRFEVLHDLFNEEGENRLELLARLDFGFCGSNLLVREFRGGRHLCVERATWQRWIRRGELGRGKGGEEEKRIVWRFMVAEGAWDKTGTIAGKNNGPKKKLKRRDLVENETFVCTLIDASS